MFDEVYFSVSITILTNEVFESDDQSFDNIFCWFCANKDWLESLKQDFLVCNQTSSSSSQSEKETINTTYFVILDQ